MRAACHAALNLFEKVRKALELGAQVEMASIGRLVRIDPEGDAPVSMPRLSKLHEDTMQHAIIAQKYLRARQKCAISTRTSLQRSKAGAGTAAHATT